MNLTKAFRGKTTQLNNLCMREYQQGITFSSNCGGKSNQYSFKVDPFDYLNVAKAATRRLKQISGMDYCIMAKHPDSSTWRSL